MKRTYNRIIFFINLGNLLFISCCQEPTETIEPPGSQPTVTTTSATSITSSGATLTGSVNPNGLQTNVWFEYGTSSTLSDHVGTNNVGTISGNNFQNFEYDLYDLEAGSTYYFRIVAENTAGTVRGSILSFETLLDNLSGIWTLSTESDFSNDDFTATLNVTLDLTQTNELLDGYTQDVYALKGTFSELSWLILRKGNDEGYLLQDASGNIVNGGINVNTQNKLLEFDLASTDFIQFRGVAPGYKTMWGDITLKLDMTNVYGTEDGIITLTGMWNAERE